MIVRLWKVKVDPVLIEQYALWEKTRSLPMFKELPGCLGVLFLRSKEYCFALSMWKSMSAVEALEGCPLYVQTSGDYENSGMLIGEPELCVFEATAGFILGHALGDALPVQETQV